MNSLKKEETMNDEEPELPFCPPLEPTTPKEGTSQGTDFQERPECDFG